MELTPDQSAAADMFMHFMADPDQSKMIISGPAGSGKSTLVRHILNMIEKEMRTINLIMGNTSGANTEVIATAPTNKAARVIGDITDTYAKTIHSFLGLKVVNDHSTGKTKLQKTKEYKVYRNTLLIIDEASFIDSYLLKEIEDATIGCKILFIGDEYQLAPTMEAFSPVFHQGYPQANLTTIVRTENDNCISKLSRHWQKTVETGKFKPMQITDDTVVWLDGPEFQEAVNNHFATAPSHCEDSVILSWTNQRVIDYASYIRKLQGKPELIGAGETVISNKPILFGATRVPTDGLVNVEDIIQEDAEYYGVQGRVLDIHTDSIFMPNSQYEAKQLLKLLAKNKSWTDYFNVKERWADFRTIHSSTVHKSQGSTYNNVYIDLSDISRCRKPDEFARMMYVAISRAKNKVYMYGKLPSKFGG